MPTPESVTEATRYSTGEILAIVSGVCLSVTTMVVTIITALRSGRTEKKGEENQKILHAQTKQLNGQDTTLQEIKEQNNGNLEEMAREMRLIREGLHSLMLYTRETRARHLNLVEEVQGIIKRIPFVREPKEKEGG